MPSNFHEIPNPPPEKSQLPDDLLKLAVNLDDKKKSILSQDELAAVKAYRRAANYIAAAMIFLKSNTLCERKVEHSDIKPRLLGHWGTCPGLTLVYAHANLLIKRHKINMFYVVGPGHGAPAILASLWLEGALTRFYPDYSFDAKGLSKLISGFSTPGGFPSHINAECPGSIHEGGELGYALAVAWGAVMDNPDLIVTCVVGDGEAETGPTATAWHAAKYIDPKESGAVIPIVHVNGFKISERTIYGTMDDKEMVALFSGYGYQVRFVEDLENIDADLAASMDWALSVIRKIQSDARSGKPQMKPRWPVLIMRTPKGWTGPKKLGDEIIEGSFHAHQVPLPAAATDDEQLALLNQWLNSYKPAELFNKDGTPKDLVTSIIPEDHDLRMGQRKETYAAFAPLKVRDWKEYSVTAGTEASCMLTIGNLLDQVFVDNPHNLRLFSPDELESNKLNAVFKHTHRDFQWDPETHADGGRVIEILSEHTCQGLLQGYTLTGRYGIFPSYEAFLGIIHTMMVQYAKFIKICKETKWREDIGSLNYIETSTWTRQEHNGFSHQNPSFIGAVLNLKSGIKRVYLPPDANCFLSTVAHCLRSKNYINLMVGSKQPSAVWLTPKEADAHCQAGAGVWPWASTDKGVNPDIVLCGIGAEMMFEVVAAAALLRKIAPELRVRVVNVTDLMVLGATGTHPHAMSNDTFNAVFTEDKYIHFNYHGYPAELKGLLFHRPNLDRVSVAGYEEEGTTTTPFSMMLCNHTSRFDVAMAAIRGAKGNQEVQVKRQQLLAGLDRAIHKANEYAMQYGKDTDDCYALPEFPDWKPKNSAPAAASGHKTEEFFVN